MACRLLPLLLPLLLAVSASAQVFLSIDCGASEPHTDANGIKWVGDGPYVQRGESHTVVNTTAVPREWATLRAFTSRRKNCYTIPVSGGGQILLRASFYYGNYDGRASPPIFGLIFDGNKWGRVQTTAGGMFSYEAIYVVTNEATSVCFAQINPGQFPFVSAIEVRSLDRTMYPNFDTTRWLFMWDRLAFGAASSIIRYPDDPYDRRWMRGGGGGLTVLRNESAVVVSSAPDQPPEAVLQAAVATNSTSRSIGLSTSLPSESTEININLYFAEMQRLGSGESRIVQVTVDGELLDAGSMAVPSDDVLELQIYNVTANASTSFVVAAAPGSTLPPLINAMEVFSVGDPLQATNSDDVDGLASLKQLWPVLNDSTGDPCLPTPYNWEWVGCSSDDTPRITALNLSGFGLSGELPEFSSVALSALETIDLHNNSFHGPIPLFLGTLPNLKELNLADNNFNGSVPSSLTENSNLRLDVSGNPNLQCTSADSCSGGGSASPATRTFSKPGSSGKKKKSSNTGLIVGIAVPLAVVFFAVVGGMVFLHQKRTAAALAAAGGKPNGHGAPGGPASHPPPAVDGAARPPATDDYRVEIEQQMGSELADLMAQQAQQQYARSPDMAPESTLLRQQQV